MYNVVSQHHFLLRYHKSDLEELAAVSSIMRQAEEAEERFARWNDGQRVKVEQNNQVRNRLFGSSISTESVGI